MYIIGGRVYQEDPNQKIGGGSEGQVFLFPDDPDRQCVKIFHLPEADDQEGKDIAKFRERKVHAITTGDIYLPDPFIVPEVPAYDRKNHIIGYRMKKVPRGFVKIRELLTGFRLANKIGAREVSLLFASIVEDILSGHSRGVVFGDINMGFILINAALGRAYVDGDSWAYPDFPCLATTELFCHPELYPNLGKAGKHVAHKPYHDLFSIAIMYVQLVIQGAHPFKMGIHPKCSGLRERVEQGVTIFDSDVDYPKILAPPEILSDDILHHVVCVLKRQTVEPLNAELLRLYAREVVECKNCGAQYHSSRSHCPKCQEKTMIVPGKFVAFMINETFFQTSGTILFVQVIDGCLRMVCRKNGAIFVVTVDKSGKKDVLQTALKDVVGARYRFFGCYLVVCELPMSSPPIRSTVYRIEKGGLRLIEETTTGALENEAALIEGSSRYLYRTAGNVLLCVKPFGENLLLEQAVCQVFHNQTWFTVDRVTGADREVVFGYDRALQEWQWFVVHGTSDGERFAHYDISLPVLRSREKMTDFAVYFNQDSVLLVRAMSYYGKECIRYTVIGLDGKVHRNELVEESDRGYECWLTITGKLFQGTGILHATEHGVVKQMFTGNVYTPLAETDGVVGPTDKLFRFGQSVGVARTNAILTITKK